MLTRINSAWRLLNWRAARARAASCPSCGPSLIIKLDDNEISIRCLRCGASAIHMSIISVLDELVPDLGSKTVYELSSRGPLFQYLRRRAGSVVCSEYYDDVTPGRFRDGIQCQNVESLTYDDESFDLCTSTQVFEHVANDLAGFSEICRVLRPAGLFVLTVPITESGPTVERAGIRDGAIHHLLPPKYHTDRIRGHDKVLVFRDYGPDIVERLKRQGFADARILMPRFRVPWEFSYPVVVAARA